MISELRTTINHLITDLEQRSAQNGGHVYQLSHDILSGEICQQEVTARLDRVREVHQKLRAELLSLARDVGAKRGLAS